MIGSGNDGDARSGGRDRRGDATGRRLRRHRMPMGRTMGRHGETMAQRIGNARVPDERPVMARKRRA